METPTWPVYTEEKNFIFLKNYGRKLILIRTGKKLCIQVGMCRREPMYFKMEYMAWLAMAVPKTILCLS